MIAHSTAKAVKISAGDHLAGAATHGRVAGTPSLTVPMGESHGLPIGLTFMGPAYAEGELISFGFAFEQATKARQAPAFKPSVSQ